MTDQTTTATVLEQRLELRVTGQPDVRNKYGSGHVRATEVTLAYQASGMRAHVYGRWVREDGELTDARCSQPYTAHENDTSNWPDWLAELATQHAPAALVAEVRRLRAQVAMVRDRTITDVADWLNGHGQKDAAYLVRTVDIPAAQSDPCSGCRYVPCGNCPASAVESHVVADDSDDPEHVDDCPGCDTAGPDTLPAWLHQRFGTRGRYGQNWDALSDDDRAYWEHQAAAVRRAVARGGFKAAPAEQQAAAADGEETRRDCECGGTTPHPDCPIHSPAANPRTVCVCGHTRAEHARVSGRLLCDACGPDSTENLTCDGFDAL